MSTGDYCDTETLNWCKIRQAGLATGDQIKYNNVGRGGVQAGITSKRADKEQKCRQKHNPS